METLYLTLFVFAVSHIVPAIGQVRRALIGMIGKVPYIVGYSMLSVGLLGWVGIAYSEAPYIELWMQQPWMRWVPTVLMLPACMLLVGTFTSPNPLSVGVKADRFDPEKPGVVSVTRHPLIWGLLLWAVAHIVPNGDLASVVMFGFFVVMSLGGPKSLDKKAKRQLGAARWADLSKATSSIPFLAALLGRTKIDWPNVLCQPAIGGLVLYAVLMGGHLFAIGVDPLP